MAELTRDAGVAFAVAYIPSPEIGFAIAEYPPSRVSRWGARVGVRVIDALPAMRRANRNTPTYWDDDIHCTPAGYGVIAQVLFDELTSNCSAGEMDIPFENGFCTAVGVSDFDANAVVAIAKIDAAPSRD